MKQPLETDTDAQLHKERVISVRKQSEIGFSSSTRKNDPDEMRTSWKLFDVMKFQEEIKITQKTAASPQVSAVRSTDDPSRQQRSCQGLRENVVRERKVLHTARIGSRRNGARSA